MGEILVRRAIDRSKYPKTMMYVDKQGNICKAERPPPLSEEDKEKRDEQNRVKYHAYLTHKQKLRDAVNKAKKQAKQNPTVELAEALELARDAYDDFKETNWREWEA